MAEIQRYAVPASLDEAVGLMAERDVTVLAGGTDLMLQTRSGVRQFRPVLLNLRRIAELQGIEENGQTIRIGAMTTVTEILESSLLRARAGVLTETADCFASSQVRNSATIGGNVCNASPAGDLIIPLILLDAAVELASSSGGSIALRNLPLCDFFLGPGKTRIEANELVVAFRFDAPGEGFVARFDKFGTRPALDIAIVSLGIAGTRRNGVLESARVAFGAVAPIPLRGRGTEAAIEQQPLNDQVVARAVETALEEISPISDVRASAWYRKRLIRILTERLLRDVSQRAD